MRNIFKFKTVFWILSLFLFFTTSCNDDEFLEIDKGANLKKSIEIEKARMFFQNNSDRFKEINLVSTHRNNNENSSIAINWNLVREDVVYGTSNSSIDVPAYIEGSSVFSRIVFVEDELGELNSFMLHWYWEETNLLNDSFTGKIFLTDVNGNLKEVYLVTQDQVTESYYVPENSTYRYADEDDDDDCLWEDGCVNLEDMVVMAEVTDEAGYGGDGSFLTSGYLNSNNFNTTGGVGFYYSTNSGIDEIITVDSPDDPIEDIAEELECFDTNQPATITIYADQPDPNRPHIDRVGMDVGHSFITIQQGNYSFSYGFYPESGWGYPWPTDGILGTNGNYQYDVSVTNTIQGNQLQALINLSITYQNGQYELSNQNCTNFAMQAAILAGFSIDVNQCIGNWHLGEGPTPGMFGEHLRNIDLPQGATPDYDGGVSPININCP